MLRKIDASEHTGYPVIFSPAHPKQKRKWIVYISKRQINLFPKTQCFIGVQVMLQNFETKLAQTVCEFCMFLEKILRFNSS